jgi:hypothetical protein
MEFACVGVSVRRGCELGCAGKSVAYDWQIMRSDCKCLSLW